MCKHTGNDLGRTGRAFQQYQNVQFPRLLMLFRFFQRKETCVLFQVRRPDTFRIVLKFSEHRQHSYLPLKDLSCSFDLSDGSKLKHHHQELLKWVPYYS